MAKNNVFAVRTFKAVLSSFLLSYTSASLVSLRTILNLSFSLYSVLYVPAVLVAAFVFVKVTLRTYVRSNVPCKNRLRKAVRGVHLQAMSCALLCSASAWCLSCLNSFNANENHWLLINAGCAIAGAIYHYESIYNVQDLHFPIIQTTKYTMFMSKVQEHVLKSMKKSFAYTLFVFIPLYGINPVVCADIYFIIHLWFSISFVLYLFYSFQHIVYLTMTEHVKFPIITIAQDSFGLLEALNCDTKIIKSLALYDLYLATINDVSRRKDIFSLSFAGNVPQSWKTIFNFCINNINHITEEMTNTIQQLPPTVLNRRVVTNARLIELNGISKSKEQTISKPNKITQFLEKSRLYNYLFGQLEKDKTLEEFESVVWCCYILCNLAVASLKEDEYGVVREHLGQIVSSILNLKNQLELQRREFDEQNKKKIEYFKTHVKSCAVMLALNFSMYANDIGLDEAQLNNFKKIIASLNDC
ncbi:nucleoporin Ndc1 [Adelges cooleyi]|uniref:nucleoporin Ndc1 n=1 Tax=Adelges cooleyi TaxID=133065 RepID=UPI00217F7AE5|nr:nucleoporin Ndc1 [Adelges cooleyi]